jgi:DNA-binding NarL/FixJ family response regulator
MDSTSHERLLQLLSTQLIELNTLQRMAQEEEAASVLPTIREGLDELTQLAHEALTLVRCAVEELPPAELEGVTLPEALARMVEERAERLAISSRIAISGVDEQGQPRNPAQTLTPTSERLLLLLLREALYGIEHHREVHRLRLAFSYSDDGVQLGIEDDGLNLPVSTPGDTGEQDCPIPPFENGEEDRSIPRTDRVLTPIARHLRQRFIQLGGSLEIQTLEERGTRVQAKLPYSTVPQSETALVVPAPGQLLPVVPSQPITDPLRVLIVDSQTVTRAGLRRLLESYPGLQVIGEAADGVQAASETVELGPQVVLMDAQLPEGQTLSTLRQIKQLNPDTRVLLLATQDREEYLYEAIRAGADGYILKDIAPDELVQAIRTIARGEVLIQSQIAGRLLTRYGRQGRNSREDTLTAREQEVLRLLARGLRNKEIAARLYVSERTVTFHLANIYQKLNVSGRTEALSRALEQGLITL